MVLNFHGRESSVDDIRERLGTARDGTTGYELVRVARDLGMQARGVKAQDLVALKEVPLPAIAHYTQGHFVVLEPRRPARWVRVVDPMRGRLDLSFEEFRHLFSGVLVLFQTTPSFRKSRDRSWVRFLRDALRERWGFAVWLGALSLALQGIAFA